MKLEVACFCDMANERAGRLNIIGVFDKVESPSFPYEISSCALVYRIRFSAADQGKQEFKLILADVDGNALIPELNAEIDLPTMDDTQSHVSNFVLNLQGLKIPQAGGFSADLFINHKLLLSLPLKAVALESQVDEIE
jgi:hypothetical protein